ncbi:transcriptional regulator [Lacticaseibacillus manihotivorans DSM 13343 = JCM 12514]|jgi:predicted transcriptional regulator|uniref:Transcriptional regulator n=2 Tax=Lacticaseibacillus manihotivorans TaxID=88233 RepID=A0A0R1QYR3_9LACO|nr:transcriptional regulator [Lacticaseibacillus manihotivorans DSM 13343 = JCM 12514]
MMATKHEQILQYIANLAVGTKISVRTIAKQQQVSEGTAYRAIKEAENTGLVSTIERVGTIRIEQKPINNIDSLTLKALLKLIDGKVLGGSAGLTKKLDKFVIGAMTPDEMIRYITPNALVIIGNREDAQKLALENGAAVLITGGFMTSDAVIAKANAESLPVMQTSYDTFTVATMINRALSDQAIKQDILTVAAVYSPLSKVKTATPDGTVADFLRLRGDRSDFALPIITAGGRLVGMVADAQVHSKKTTTPLERVMVKDPLTVKPYLSITSVGHTMQGNGLDVLPVVDDSWQLLGIVTRHAVFASMADLNHNRDAATYADQVARQMSLIESTRVDVADYRLHTTPMMTNQLGTLSFGVLNEAVNTAATGFLNRAGRRNVLVAQLSLHTFRPIQLETTVNIHVRPLELTRHEATLDIELQTDGLPVAKALVTCQLLERN